MWVVWVGDVSVWGWDECKQERGGWVNECQEGGNPVLSSTNHCPFIIHISFTFSMICILTLYLSIHLPPFKIVISQFVWHCELLSLVVFDYRPLFSCKFMHTCTRGSSSLHSLTQPPLLSSSQPLTLLSTHTCHSYGQITYLQGDTCYILPLPSTFLVTISIKNQHVIWVCGWCGWWVMCAWCG